MDERAYDKKFHGRKKFLRKNAKKIAFCVDNIKSGCYNFSMLKIQHLST